jgi:hypothetical protein
MVFVCLFVSLSTYISIVSLSVLLFCLSHYVLFTCGMLDIRFFSSWCIFCLFLCKSTYCTVRLMYLFISLFVCLFIYMFLWLCVSLSVYFFVFLLFCLFVLLFVCLYVCLFFCVWEIRRCSLMGRGLRLLTALQPNCLFNKYVTKNNIAKIWSNLTCYFDITNT